MNNIDSGLKSTLAYEGPRQLVANQLLTATLRVQLGEAVKAGGHIAIAIRHMSDFGDAQMDNPRAENFATIQSSRGGLSWSMNSAHAGKRHPWNRGFDLKLLAGELTAGDTVTICLGDRSGGSPGHRCQSFAQTAFAFRLGIDPLGDNQWRVMPENRCEGIEIVGSVAVALRVTLSDMTSRGGLLRCHIKAEDAYGNIASAPPPHVRLLLDGRTSLAVVPMKPNQASVVDVDLGDDGPWHNIVAATDDGALYATSNPAGPSPMEGYHLYWGEIHAQSGLCDGTNSPKDLYTYARDAAGLDFAAVTSHDFEITARDWQEIQAAAAAAHDSGKFVTFLGYEWSGRHERGGDNNIYFRDGQGPLVYSAAYPGHPQWNPAENQVVGSRTLAEVIAQLKAQPSSPDFMIVPHCGGRQCNLDFYDATVMPLFEIHSCHRTYEYVARQAIARGLRIGFVGGSDDHRGAIGDSHPSARDRYFSSHSGLVAVYAKDLTRESLWEAFFQKRAYATSGPRIVLDVRIDGVPMGGQVAAKAGQTVKMSVLARLDGLLDGVEIVKDTMTIDYLQGVDNQVSEFRQDVDIHVETGAHAYYVKVRQVDGGTAWSSPIWIVAME